MEEGNREWLPVLRNEGVDSQALRGRLWSATHQARAQLASKRPTAMIFKQIFLRLSCLRLFFQLLKHLDSLRGRWMARQIAEHSIIVLMSPLQM